MNRQAFRQITEHSLRDVERRPVLCSFKRIEGGSAFQKNLLRKIRLYIPHSSAASLPRSLNMPRTKFLLGYNCFQSRLWARPLYLRCSKGHVPGENTNSFLSLIFVSHTDQYMMSGPYRSNSGNSSWARDRRKAPTARLAPSQYP